MKYRLLIAALMFGDWGIVVTWGQDVGEQGRHGTTGESGSTQPCLPPQLVLDLGERVTMELVLVLSGSFLMGSPVSEDWHVQAEGPQHRVTIERPFYIGKFEVTIEQFGLFVAETGYRTDAERGTAGYLEGRPGAYVTVGQGFAQWADDASWRNPGFTQGANEPVVMLSLNDANEFCSWLSRRSGRRVRLPSEAEWEYACRAGTTSRFWWGEDPGAVARMENTADLRATTRYPRWVPRREWDDGYVHTAPVGTYRANPFGLYDMTGNVLEWCEDSWHDNYTNAPGEGKPWRGEGEGEHVSRGSAWNGDPESCAFRSRRPAPVRLGDQGMRVVADAH